MDPVRERFVQAALAAVDLSANPSDPDRLQDYLDLIAHGETDDRKNEMGAMSGCGLVVAGIWRNAGVKDARLDAPYKTYTAISRLMKIAYAHRAWRPFKRGQLPDLGDMVLIGDNSNGGIEHVYTVHYVAWMEDKRALLHTVDGGQRDDERYQCVRARQRAWRGNLDIPYTATDPGAGKGPGRVIQGWVDVTKLPM